MTNYEKIKEMSKDELIKFISNIVDGDLFDKGNKIGHWFKIEYCDKCPDIDFKWGEKIEHWKECEFEGKCPHQDWESKTLIKMWLDGEWIE